MHTIESIHRRMKCLKFEQIQECAWLKFVYNFKIKCINAKQHTLLHRNYIYVCSFIYTRKRQTRKKNRFHKSQGKVSLPTVKTSYYINDPMNKTYPSIYLSTIDNIRKRNNRMPNENIEEKLKEIFVLFWLVRSRKPLLEKRCVFPYSK